MLKKRSKKNFFLLRSSNFRLQKAFTLVELLVVISIMGLLTTGAIFSAARSKRVTSLNRSAREVLLALRDAQNESLITQEGTQGVTPCGFGVHYLDNKSFSIFMEETDVPGEECIAVAGPNQNIDRLWGGYGNQSILETFTLTEDNYVKIVSSFVDIYFEPPDGLTYINGVHDNSIAPNFVIKLCLIEDCVHYQKTVRVDLGGNIEIE